MIENIVKELFRWMSENVLGYTLITVIPAIFTSFGISYKDMFDNNFLNKNKRAVRHVLLYKVWDESLESYIKRLGIYLLENLLIVLDTLILVGIVELFVLFSSVAIGKIHINGPFILVLIMVVLILVAAFIGKCQYLQRLKILGLVFCESILVVIFVGICFKNIQNLNIYLYILLGVSFAVGIAIIYTFYNIGLYRNYKCCKYLMYIIRGIKYLMIMTCNFYFFIIRQNIENLFCWRYMWIAINLLEFILVVKNDKTRLAEVTIYQKNKNEITKNKIIQYAGEKIGFKTLDGKEKVVDSDTIEKIVYTRSHLFNKKVKCKKKVKCTLRNGKILQYQGYQLITDLWMQLYKTENGVREVLVIKTQDTEEIVEEECE